MNIILNIFLVALQAYFAFYILSWIVRLIAASFYPAQPSSIQREYVLENESVILIPAYNANERLISVLASVFENGAKHKVFILFQNTRKEIIQQAQKYPVYCEEKSFENIEGYSYYVALNYAIEQLKVLSKKENFNLEYLLLLDKDNILHDDFLMNIEKGILAGYDVIQGALVPHKQLNTPSEAYGIISEILNDDLYHKSNIQLFDYLELNKSGFAIRFNMFEKAVKFLDSSVLSTNQNLQIQLLLNFPSIKMLFVPEAKIYDEKKYEIEESQYERINWFNNQYFNAIFYTRKLIKSALQNGKFAPINYVITLFRPSLILQLLILLKFSIIEILIGLNGYFWSFLLVLFYISNMSFLYRHNLLTAVINMFLLFSKTTFSDLSEGIKGTSKSKQGTFIHTFHE